jgi:hypothetical protein
MLPKLQLWRTKLIICTLKYKNKRKKTRKAFMRQKKKSIVLKIRLKNKKELQKKRKNYMKNVNLIL